MRSKIQKSDFGALATPYLLKVEAFIGTAKTYLGNIETNSDKRQ